MEAHNEEELGKALKRGENEIVIEGEIGKHIIHVHGIGDIAWGIVVGATAIGVAAVMATIMTAGTTAPINALVATPALAGAVGIIGVPATVSLVSIGVAGGGVASLNKLRKYKIEKISENKIRLIKK